MSPDDLKFCFKCGEVNPEYTVEGYKRRCGCCGSLTVVTLAETIDFLNQRHTYYGDAMFSEDSLDEDFNLDELDFDSTSAYSVGLSLEDDEY